MKFSQRPILFFRLSFILILAMIFYLATTDVGPSLLQNTNDKVQHLLAFGALAFLADFSFPKQSFNREKFFSLVAIGILIEFIQSYLPYREASFFDILADTLGIAIYAFFYRQLKHLPILEKRWRT